MILLSKSLSQVVINARNLSRFALIIAVCAIITKIQSILLSKIRIQSYELKFINLITENYSNPFVQQCIVMMDHHCMWANACVGLHNHAIFLQLNFFGMIGALFSVLTIRICDEHTFYQGVSDSGLFFTIIKYLDLLIGKFLMILFAWNMYVAMQGYTHLEFKDLMESQIRKKNFEAKVKQNNSEEGLQLQSNSENNSNVITHNHVKFNYGYKTLRENLAWVFGTTSFFNAFMFVDWFHDERLKWTGVEWTVIYYWDSLMDFYEKQYGKIYNQDYDQKLEELDISIKDE